MSTVKAGFSFTENFETLLINKSQSMSDVIDGRFFRFLTWPGVVSVENHFFQFSFYMLFKSLA